MSLRQTEPSRVARSPRPEATAGPPSRHGPIAQLLIASSPLSLILVAYAVGDWIAGPIDLGRPGTVNRLGFGLHRTGGATVDAHVFGSLPSVRLQEWLVDGSAHWYDAVARSTGFEPWRPREVVLNSHDAAVAEACRPAYDELHARRLRL